MVAAFSVALALDWQQTNRVQADQRLAVSEAINGFRSALEQAIQEKILVTEGLAATVAARPDITQQEFLRASGRLVHHVDGVISVTAAPGLVVEMAYPFSASHDAVGTDLRERADMLDAVEQAIATRQTSLYGPVDLIHGSRGFVTSAAVIEFYAEAFRSDFWGVVSIEFDAASLFQVAGLSGGDSGFDFIVQDADGAPIAGTLGVLTRSPSSTEIRAPGVDWRLSIYPQEGWITAPPNRLQNWLIIFGAAMVALALMRAFRWTLDRKHMAEARLSEAVDALDDAFSLYDADSRFVMSNQRYRELYPSAADLMVPGTHFSDLLRRGIDTGQYPLAEGREEEWIAERVDAQRNPGEAMETQLADGRWLRIVERRTASGNIAGFRVDITELKQALARSEAANEAKTEFLNTVSHELRTPLTVMLGYSSFLQNIDALPSHRRLIDSLKSQDTVRTAKCLEEFETEIARFSGQIELSGKQLLGHIADILDMAAIEQGTLDLRPEVIDLSDVIADTVSDFEDDAAEKGIALSAEGDRMLAHADPRRLRQILKILVGNAVKFTDEGSVRVVSKTVNGRASVEVIDTGTGIPEDHLNHIFEQFNQVDASSTRRHGGLGLGLPIAQQLAELQGGGIVARSVDGEGSVFTLELQIPESAQGEAA